MQAGRANCTACPVQMALRQEQTAQCQALRSIKQATVLMCSAGTVLGWMERIGVSMRAVSGFIPSRGEAQSQLALPRQLAWGAHMHGLFHNCVNLVLVLLPALHHTKAHLCQPKHTASQRCADRGLATLSEEPQPLDLVFARWKASSAAEE